MQLKRPLFALSSISLAVLLGACGGGGSSSSDTTTSTTPSVSTTSSISGTVPGTLIEAFCADGSYYKVNSTDDGTSEHPFTIELPNGVDCRLVMTTHEDDVNARVISAIQFNSGTVISGLINLGEDVNLGYIDLPMTYVPLDDTNGDHVVDLPLTHNVTLPNDVVLRDVSFDPLDDDGDDIPDYYEDDDGDGEFNGEDADDDNDGTDDVDEVDNNDFDGDGIDDVYDRDDDNDGTSDTLDSDDDNDGTPDSEDSDHDDDNETDYNVVYTPVDDYTLTQGRLLASQCAQCHGTNGYSTNSWDSLAGESAAEIIEEMREIKAGEEDPIMQAQAHGYTDAEIEALAAWFSTQPSAGDSEEEDD